MDENSVKPPTGDQYQVHPMYGEGRRPPPSVPALNMGPVSQELSISRHIKSCIGKEKAAMAMESGIDPYRPNPILNPVSHRQNPYMGHGSVLKEAAFSALQSK